LLICSPNDLVTAVYGGRGPLYDKLDWLWVMVITLAVRFVPDCEPVRARFDTAVHGSETTYKKTGPKCARSGRYRRL
jgi:hypothetical protein